MSSQIRRPAQGSAGGTDANDAQVAVPTGEEWLLDSAAVEFTADGTVGDRQIRIQIRDGSGNVYYEVAAPSTIAASTGPVTLVATPQVSREAQIADDLISVPLPTVDLPAGWEVRAFDSAGVSATDDLTLRVAARKRLVG